MIFNEEKQKIGSNNDNLFDCFVEGGNMQPNLLQ